MDKTAAIVLADGFETIEALAPADTLRRAGAKVTLASCTGAQIATSAQGIAVTCDAIVDDVDLTAFDLMVTPGGATGVHNLAACKPVMDALAARMEANAFVGSICAAPSLLATLGLLEGRTATCYPGWETDFPAGVRPEQNGVYRDGNLVTGSGPAFALPFGLALVGLLMGVDAEKTVGDGMLWPDAR